MDERDQQQANGDSGNKHGFVDRVREQAGAQLATHKDSATEGMGTIAQAVRRTTAELRETKHETMAEYVEQAAVRLERWSEQLKHKDIGELLREAQNLARRQPVAFVGRRSPSDSLGRGSSRAGRHARWCTAAACRCSGSRWRRPRAACPQGACQQGACNGKRSRQPQLARAVH